MKLILALPCMFLLLSLCACSLPETKPDSRWTVAEQGAYAAYVSLDGSLAVVSSPSDGILVYAPPETTPLYRWRHQGEGNNLVGGIYISADNQAVVTSDREAFALWDLASGDPVGFWRIDESSIRDIAVANGGRGILVGRGNGRVMFFEPNTGRRLEFLGHSEKINAVDISPNGKYALTGGNDYTAYLWNTDTGQVVYRFNHPSRVTKVVLDPKGRYAFTADSKKQARIWDLTTGKERSRLNYIERQKIFSTARFSEDGRYLLTGSPSRNISLWDTDSGDTVKEWRVKPKPGSQPEGAVVYGVGFMPENKILSISSSGFAETWSR